MILCDRSGVCYIFSFEHVLISVLRAGKTVCVAYVLHLLKYIFFKIHVMMDPGYDKANNIIIVAGFYVNPDGNG